MEKILANLGLNKDNSIVIGSGILQALKIRQSYDIDLVVTKDTYNRLKDMNKFEILSVHGREELRYGTFEIGIIWNVLAKPYTFEDFKKDSVIINGVRYISLDFLYRAKKSWAEEKTARPKDLQDIKLMEDYKNKHVSSN